jgi:hypothetical protein
MYQGIGASLMLLLTLTTGIGSAMAQSTSGDPPKAGSMETDIKKIKETMLGNWESIAPEIRPSKNPDGSLKPFYLKRAFKYLPSDRFELDVVNSADPYGAVPLAKIRIVGHMFWQGPHPIAPGAQKVDFVADEAYEVTPLVQGFADVLNKVASAGYAPWAVNSSHNLSSGTSEHSAEGRACSMIPPIGLEGKPLGVGRDTRGRTKTAHEG